MNNEAFLRITSAVDLRRSETHGHLTIALAVITFIGSMSMGFAQEDTGSDGLIESRGNLLPADTVISRTDPNARALVRIGAMQAWAIEDQTGNLTTALTTKDGLTIIGRIIGPRGEDITAALLATVPMRTDDRIAAISPTAPSGPAPLIESAMTQGPVDPVLDSRIDTDLSPTLNRVQNTLPPVVSSLPAATPTSQDSANETIASAPITAVERPSAEIQAGLDTIFSQAGAERIWFSAGTPKPEAPVVYMLTDPDCPHCQWTIDQMQGAILRGEIDLRIIFTPITGVSGFETSLSILHSDDISGTFMAHMTATTRGTAAVANMDTNQADKGVIQGVADNINWMRANRMPGVPFFLYQTDQGARFAFSELPPDILAVAQADTASP
jgi:thiol:disulfide interchange protein DsbG